MNYLQWLANQTDTLWWHDSANKDEQQRALVWGATGMTTNPFLVNQTLENRPEMWRESIQPALSLFGDEKVLGLMKTVTGYYAQQLASLYRQGKSGNGYVCVQTNPNKCGDYAYMLDQARQYATWFPNVVIKLPATKAGIRVYEECAALGYNVAATVSFTVPQVLAVAEAAKRGIERARRKGLAAPLTIAVLMVGRLDDYLRDVAQDLEANILESDIRQAGTACIKKAYRLFEERGYETYLMPAGCRGAYHITALSGAKMIMSISVKIQEELTALAGPFKTQIDQPVDDEVVTRLLTLSEFRKAYEEDGMQAEDFITYGSSNRTIDQFINSGWNPLLGRKEWHEAKPV